jgi:hypothetical protein
MESKRIHTENTKEQFPATNSIQKKGKTQSAVSLQDNRPKSVLQKKTNRTGLPDNLKSGIENLSGHSMDDVKVHYNSDKPAQLNAHAYAQGSDIHLASGQEKHLPHEAWHVIQQKQGRVKPTLQMKGEVNVNDDKGLEKEADVMGAKALQMHSKGQNISKLLSDTKKIANQNSKYSIQKVSKSKTLQRPTLQETAHVVQRILIDRNSVSDSVWQVYSELGPEAKLLLKFSSEFHSFFDLSPQEQIDFLHALDRSTLVINTLIQSNSRAITNSKKTAPQFPLLQLQSLFLKLNPNFMDNLLAVTRGHTGTFHFSKTDSISITSFPSISSLEPRKALLGPDEQKRNNRLVKQSQISIHSVMNEKNLSRFLILQNLFQEALQSMNDLKSIGYEFEFASFANSDGVYSDIEIIPSHQLMAKSAIAGNFFGLSWRLESDSKNTLELVSPPFVFSRDDIGQTKSYTVKREIESQAKNVADSIEKRKGSLKNVANTLSKSGIGFNWNIDSKYKNYRILSNKKSGGGVYAQRNESLYPHEIGKLLDDKFNDYAKHNPPSESTAIATFPSNVALLVRKHFLAALPKDTEHSDAVKQAVSVFSRYASNVLAIPSFRHRQVTGERKDTMATDIKETLEVWVKTDPLNVLKHLLKEKTDLDTFHIALHNAKLNIMKVFINASIKFVQEAARPSPPEPTIKEIGERMKALSLAGLKKTGRDLLDFAKEELIQERAHKGPDPSIAVQGYTQEMLVDVEAFIQRALQVDKHVEAHPKSTTSEFLSETFGTGEGVRKGTYIKGIPTSKGPMYVTELR